MLNVVSQQGGYLRATTLLLLSCALSSCRSGSRLQPRHNAVTDGLGLVASVPVAPSFQELYSLEPTAAERKLNGAALPALDFVRADLGGLSPAAAGPWIVALHGLGDRPQAFVRLFPENGLRVHVYSVQAPLQYGDGFDWFGVRVSAPEPELARAVSRAANAVAALCERLSHEAQNRGKPLVTGFSQGGYLAFALAALFPGSVAAAFPISGSLPMSLYPKSVQLAPGEIRPDVIAFHGTADRVVDVTPTRAVVAGLQAAGYGAQLVEYAGLGHQISAELRSAWITAISEHLPPLK